MTGKTVNKTHQKKAVNKTFTLLKNGINLTDARKIVANEYGVAPSAIARWQKVLHLETPRFNKRTNLVTNNNGIIRQTSIDKDFDVRAPYDSSNSLKDGLQNLFHSLITKNGEFTTQDATAICKVANNMLNTAKYELQVRKYAEKMSKRDSARAVKNLLI